MGQHRGCRAIYILESGPGCFTSPGEDLQPGKKELCSSQQITLPPMHGRGDSNVHVNES